MYLEKAGMTCALDIVDNSGRPLDACIIEAGSLGAVRKVIRLYTPAEGIGLIAASSQRSPVTDWG